MNVLELVAGTQEMSDSLNGHRLPRPEISIWWSAVALVLGIAMIVDAVRRRRRR